VNALDSPVSNRLEIKLRSVFVATSLGQDKQVGGSGPAKEPQDKKEWSEELSIPVP